MMTLRLNVQTGTSSRVYSFCEDGSGDVVPSIPYSSKVGTQMVQTLASAELLGDFGDCFEYRLQLGYDPDTVARVKTGEGVLELENSGRKRARFKAVQNRKEEEMFRLFQSTMGRTRLRLLEMAYDEDGDLVISREVMSVPVYIIPSKEKKDSYLRMINQLLDTPQFFLDDLRGQMLLNGFSTNWDDGYSSHEDASLELAAVERVLNELREPLEKICRAPKTDYHSVRRRMGVDRVRCCSARADRDIERLLGRGMPSDRVMTRVKKVTYGVPAHSVIRFFLTRLIWRCEDILLDFVAVKEKLVREIESLRRLYVGDSKNPAYLGSAYAKRQQIELIDDKIRRVNSVRMHAIDLSALRVLSGVVRPIRIFDVPRTAFAGGVGYERAYRVILDFERCRFWWVGQESNFYKTPRLSFSDESEKASRWARKFSIVYEFWCYRRLLDALETSGFECVSGRWLGSDEGSQCTYRRGDLEVRVVHGFSAKILNHESVEAFWLDPLSQSGGDDKGCSQTARELTPDFAIVFKHLTTRKMKWIVADAKSHNCMNFKQIILKREKYMRFVKHRLDDDAIGSNDAAQVWMFYAGDDEGTQCGVECPPRKSKWVEKNGFDDPQADASGYSFSATEGIVRATEGDLPRGHVHANVVALGSSNSPFEDFVSGEIVTMIRELQ